MRDERREEGGGSLHWYLFSIRFRLIERHSQYAADVNVRLCDLVCCDIWKWCVLLIAPVQPDNAWTAEQWTTKCDTDAHFNSEMAKMSGQQQQQHRRQRKNCWFFLLLFRFGFCVQRNRDTNELLHTNLLSVLFWEFVPCGVSEWASAKCTMWQQQPATKSNK